jgi:hypothetical protein
VYQTGKTAQRGFWFYGTDIATAKGTGTIRSGTVFVNRIDTPHGYSGGGNVRLGGHGLATQPGSIPGALSLVTNVGTLGRGKAKTFAIPQNLIDGMNAGTIKGLGLEPGTVGTSSKDYIIADKFGTGTEWSGAITLVVEV